MKNEDLPDMWDHTMNRRERRAYERLAIPRIGQLLKSKILNDDRLNGLPKEEIDLLKKKQHPNGELQTLFNKQEKLIKELDNLLRRKQS